MPTTTTHHLTTTAMPSSTPFIRRHALAPSLLLAALIAGCGGGGGGGGGPTAGVGSGGTGSYTVGTVTGFGSVIINGVRYDDRSASIRSDDDEEFDDDKGGRLVRTDIKLGMIAEVEGGTVTAGAPGQLSTGTAAVIRYVNEIKGELTSKTASGFTMLSQTIVVDNATVYEGTANFNALDIATNCKYAEVYAYYDVANTQYNATRVECKTAQNQPRTYRLFGIVTSTSTNQFTIDGLTVNYAQLGNFPTLAVNDKVRVRFVPSHLNGSVATLSGSDDRIRTATPRIQNRSEAKVEGVITSFTSTSSFSVNGVSVTTNGQTLIDSEGTLDVGVRVEVEGSLSNGVLTARKVEIEDENEREDEGNELFGVVSSLDTMARTFTLTTNAGRGFTIAYGKSVVGLSNGAAVEVKGYIDATGNRMEAFEIDIENDR